MIRLDKYLANHASMSRSESRTAIKDGIVTVNGVTIKGIGTKVNLEDDIYILDQKVQLTGETYLMIHKPKGFVCANNAKYNPEEDDYYDDEEVEEQDTVIDLIPDYDDIGLKIAGRLDKDTTGIVLLSTDGKWMHKVTSPNYKCVKVYELETADPINPEIVERFKRGILLKDSPKYTKPADLEILDSHKARLSLTEGRYHQVKRMFGAEGNKVTKLHRSSVGGLDLGDLAEGESRELTAEEVAMFGKK